MALSLRSRLTFWYSALLLLALVSFIAVVLLVHWRIVVREYDDSLDTMGLMATNVIAKEMGEHDNLALAAEDTEEVVRAPDHIVKVLDAAGRPLNPESPGFPLDATAQAQLTKPGLRTVSAADGSLWRFASRVGSVHEQTYMIVVGAPLKDVREHWRALVQASAIGLPLVLAIGVAGGWWLGRHGLSPLRNMASPLGTLRRTPAIAVSPCRPRTTSCRNSAIPQSTARPPRERPDRSAAVHGGRIPRVAHARLHYPHRRAGDL